MNNTTNITQNPEQLIKIDNLSINFKSGDKDVQIVKTFHLR